MFNGYNLMRLPLHCGDGFMGVHVKPCAFLLCLILEGHTISPQFVYLMAIYFPTPFTLLDMEVLDILHIPHCHSIF